MENVQLMFAVAHRALVRWMGHCFSRATGMNLGLTLCLSILCLLYLKTNCKMLPKGLPALLHCCLSYYQVGCAAQRRDICRALGSRVVEASNGGFSVMSKVVLTLKEFQSVNRENTNTSVILKELQISSI